VPCLPAWPAWAAPSAQEKLDAIDDDRQAHSGVFRQRAAAGVHALETLLNHCYRMLHDLYADLAAAEAERAQAEAGAQGPEQ
jgi:hypothetical protein